MTVAAAAAAVELYFSIVEGRRRDVTLTVKRRQDSYSSSMFLLVMTLTISFF
jgi:hypothetical protein